MNRGIRRALIQVHSWLGWVGAEVGGWPVRLMLFSGALALPVLICTGLTSFLLRKRAAAYPPPPIGRPPSEPSQPRQSTGPWSEAGRTYSD